MGLIRALKGAVHSTLADQWKDFFVCDSIPAGALIMRGKKRTDATRFDSSNFSGSDDIISKGSVIAVNEGQAMIVTDNGRIVDFTCEAGAYTFELSSAPSLFAGDLGEGLRESFNEVVKRFGHGGNITSSQKVYYINLKEIIGNKFASSSPMPYDDPFYKTVLYVNYHGVYSFKIADPIYFYAMVSGNVKDSFVVSQLTSQIDAEFYSAMDSAMNKLASENIKFSQLPSKQQELSRYMKEALSGDWKQMRGMEVISAAINKITPDDKSRTRIETFDNAAMLGGSSAAMAGRMTDAQATAFENMGNNPNGTTGMDMMGVGLGMMGINMMSNMQGQTSPFVAPVPPVSAVSAPAMLWKCGKCGYEAEKAGKFCPECGSAENGSTADSKKYDVFLSYRRDGGETTAILLRDRLVSKGYNVFLDIESLNSGSFNKKLLSVIEDCVDFIVVCSKGSLDRCINEDDWVRLEIAHALNNNKNVVPVMLRGFEWPDVLPAEIDALRTQ
ncbi:MAG: TIR domain-containing protein, partial [Oscillospiraceae bacterium]|nr:TIR domain-containing protein [Oscillospiraceae bacterium]